MNKVVNTIFSVLVALSANAEIFIEIPPCAGDATEVIQAAIDKVEAYGGKPVTLKFSPGNYNISRNKSSEYLYHISNTSSSEENPDQTKHIGLWFRNLKNVTLDGNGAWIITHGEMTPIVVDGCTDVTLKNFTLTAADPSVPEFKVLSVDRNSAVFEVTPPSRFEIIDGNFSWVGEGWKFADGARETFYPEFAQVFYPDLNVTHRCESPIKGRKKAEALGDNIVRFIYESGSPDIHVGEIYQMRHGIRNEACAFFNESKNVVLSNIEFNFLGNFGLVGQYSENLTYDNIRCRPRLGSGRTDAGFADFVQMSGCRGKIKIINSYFEGAHDDPINIHGTHLKAVSLSGPDKITVRFMHGQSYGFTPFFKDDKIEIVDRHTLNCLQSAKVKGVERIDDYNFELTLDRKLISLPAGYTIEDLAVENVTWTPEVEISNNYFARIPTRGILITTRGKSLIENNTFFRMPMPSILVSDDARGWYESGPVKNLTIRRNLFIECGSPVIAVWPEIDRFDRPVHSNITIDSNRFIIKDGIALDLKAAENITIVNNVFDIPAGSSESVGSLIRTENCTNVEEKSNSIVSTP